MATTNTTSSSSSTEETARVHLDDSLGAAFIGLILAAVLFGVTNVQYLIFSQTSRDPRFMKWTVRTGCFGRKLCILTSWMLKIAFLWCLDVLHLILISHPMYYYLVTNFTNLEIINVPTWSLCAHVLVTTLGDFIVRLFYAWRVWVVSHRNRFLTLGVLVFASVTLGLGFGIKIFSYDSMLQFTNISWVLYTSLGSAVIADGWVAASLCFFLARNRTGFKSTDSVVNSLILYVINTGLFTSFCATACFVSFAVMPHNYIFIAFYFCLPKLYFNALLAMLNARERLRDGLSNGGSGASSYRVSHIASTSINLPVASKETTASFGTIGYIPPSPSLPIFDSEFNLTDKVRPSSIVGDVRNLD
ncbi:hypothetical protein ACEPAF_6028 [Sanghuangporus sanghuang]